LLRRPQKPVEYLIDMLRQFVLAGLLLAVAACTPTPMRWERSGAADAQVDEADCRAQAHPEAIRQLPYGNGPPIYGLYSEWSMLTWKQEIDNQRYYLERDLTRACMHNRGYELVPDSRPVKAEK
jgi:hypothetical protein